MNTLRLVLSALISSWQFFKEAVFSPNIEFTLLKTVDDKKNWIEFCYRPQQRTLLQIVTSLFFNPVWNEALFMMDCAEKMLVEPSKELDCEIMERIIAELERRGYDLRDLSYLQYRLVLEEGHNRELAYVSELKTLRGAI